VTCKAPILGICFSLALAAAGYDWNLPKGFPPPPVPADNPMTPVKVELGRYLFYDTRMSVNGSESCATCHRQELAFTDGLAHAVGSTGEKHPRGSMSLVNIAYAPALTWANAGLTSLEAQAVIPMFGVEPVELGLNGHESELLVALRRDPVYQRLFPQAFSAGSDPFTIANVTRAIAAFERSIVSMRSPYDRYRWGGEMTAISAAAKRGEIIFESGQRGRCFQCHGGWNFSGSVRFAGDTSAQAVFFNTGLPDYAPPNRGLFEQTGQPGDIGRFRVPTLRNIAVTGPYFHDGRASSLADVIAHYTAGGTDHPNKTPLLSPLSLTEQDENDLIEFLKSLTDEDMLKDERWSNPWKAPLQ
jgi:cytochrome c peroxidase